MNHGCADGGAIPPIASIDFLDHLLATLVLEIDVDIRRLAAIFRNEAGEEQAALVRIDRGDAQAIADGAVCGRAAPLAEDISAAGKGDDVVDGQEIAGVVQLSDDREFLVEPPLDVGGKSIRIVGSGIALLRAGPGQVLEMLLRGLVRRHRLVGIFVLELAKREAAGVGDLQGALDRLGEIHKKPRHLLGRLEITFLVHRQSEARFGNGAGRADAGQNVGERPALRTVIMHIVDRDERRAHGCAKFIEQAEAARLVAAITMHAGEEAARRRCLGEASKSFGKCR
jgi:hypothetical protein